jgi:hypothetical protein
MLKGNLMGLEVAADSVDTMRERDDDDEAANNFLGGSSVSALCELFEPSGRSITSPYSSSSASTVVSSKSAVMAGADPGVIFLMTESSIPASPSINEFTLLLFWAMRDGLKLRLIPNARAALLRALADNDELLEDASNRRARNDEP